MNQKRYELKLESGKVVEWVGSDPIDAATRYVDVFRDAVVVATREADRHGLFVLGSTDRII